MLIRYTEFCLNPNLRGTTADLPQHRAQALIDGGTAVEIKYASYRERLQAVEAAKPKVFATVKWAVCEAAISGRYYIGATCSAPQCSSFHFDGSPSALENLTFPHSCGCGFQGAEKIPAEICAQYRKLYRRTGVLGRDEVQAALAALPQKSQPVDMSTILPAHPTELGSEAELSPLLFLPSKEEHVDKKIFG